MWFHQPKMSIIPKITPLPEKEQGEKNKKRTTETVILFYVVPTGLEPVTP